MSEVYMAAVPYAIRKKLEIAADVSNPVWVVVCDFATLNKMEIKNLVRGKEIFVRISGGNICGWGPPSEPMSFIPR